MIINKFNFNALNKQNNNFTIQSNKKILIILMSALVFLPDVLCADIIPTGPNNNVLYYKMGGGSDFTLPPVQNTQTINLGVSGDLGAGYGCGAFNPALSIANTFNNLKSSVDNLEQTIVQNATGSLAEMPMYFLAQANPTAYNLINNALLSAHQQLDISTKSCQAVKDQISRGQNPYQDWGTISVGNLWKQHLSLTANGQEDINTAKTNVDAHSGDSGVAWVQGSKGSDGSLYAGGLSQPPIHAVSDTVKAGYNAMLLRDLGSDDPAPTGGELATVFPKPSDAQAWISNVVGDQTITTCNAAEDPGCKNNQGGISGRGLLPWITTCTDQNKTYCADTIRTNLANIVSGNSALTKENLEAVSANGIVLSPQVISSIQSMDATQQSIIVNKLAQEVSTQQVLDRALIARNILQTGAQVPVIASNQPAQKMIEQSITHLDKDIQSLAFESQVRKQMMSDTVSQVLAMTQNQQQAVMALPKVAAKPEVMQNSAIATQGVQAK